MRVKAKPSGDLLGAIISEVSCSNDCRALIKNTFIFI